MELKNGTALKGGEYIIKRKLGQGGMGITYLATMRVEVQRGLGTVTTQADVVVKEFFIGDYCERGSDTHTVTVISQRFNDAVAAGLKKFGKEARNLSQMNHPNIVHVIDLFSENQTEYIVMDYLPGGNLRDYVESHGVLSAADATQRISEVARALAFMHGQHLCHFDVKPGNVMLGANGEAVLIDFGLSKRYGADDRHTSSLLYMGLSEGFAPLEQYTDSVASFSPQTDVYALGATLYYLLTGKAPGKASYNINNVLSATRPVNIPEDLWQLILHSMQPNPEDRPADAAEFLRLLNGEIVKTPPPPPSPPPPVTPPSPPSIGGKTKIKGNSSGNKYLKYGLVAAIVAAVLFLGTWLVKFCSPEKPQEEIEQLPSAQPSKEEIKEETPPPPPPAEDNKVFDVVEQMPSYPGGQSALMQYLSSNIK
ncbi:MAG: serine/threonine protein kinase, partial [Prevotella sp.]|nr:serine/threonine protein kinase [Prevotella sp.]